MKLKYLNNMNSWQKAKIIKIAQASVDIKSITVKPENSAEYTAGQHYEICIPGESIIRKYSIVSDIYEKNYLEFGVQLIESGALSPRLWDLQAGDELEIRGPLGESFIWDSSNPAPLVLLGAGSGITPLVSIYYSYHKKYPDGQCVFIMSAKDSSRIMNYDSLKDILVTRFTTTEGRIDFDFLKKHTNELTSDKDTLFFICGPDNFIDDMVDTVLELGVAEKNIKSERFI